MNPYESEFLDILDEIKYYNQLHDGSFEKHLTAFLYALYFMTSKLTDENLKEILKCLD